MFQIFDTVNNTIDRVSQDIRANLTSVTNTIIGLQQDTSGTINNVANECIENLHVIREQVERSGFLLTNAVLAMLTAITLGLLLHLTHFSGFLRFIVWTMYVILCLHMILTYFRHSHSRPSLTSSEQEQEKSKSS